MRRPIVCTMGHPLTADGFHFTNEDLAAHGKVMVDRDEYRPSARPPLKHEVSIVHSFKARPRPNMIVFRIRDWEGREYRTSPINVYGQATSPVQINVEWMTGREQDRSVPPITIIGEFWYPEES